jgi:hypothetical protein
MPIIILLSWSAIASLSLASQVSFRLKTRRQQKKADQPEEIADLQKFEGGQRAF